MISLASIGSFLWALVLILIAFICTGNGFKQELWLYDAKDNALLFHSHVPDTLDVGLFLPKVTRVCTTGLWYLCSTANYQTYQEWVGSGDVTSIICANFTTAATGKSLRHTGANDTDTDALSLYEGSTFSGPEVFVTTRAHTGIKNQIRGIGITGASDWMLFEGQELDGKSVCHNFPAGYSVSTSYVSSALATIGSVFKGCDAQEVQNYKMLHKSKFVNNVNFN